jgi:16S rRNA (guanine966-N2)-methyltransferase
MPQSRSAKSRSSVRIISGRWRGRRIPVVGNGVRPTGDRIRETLFNWLQSDIQGTRCLDMFAGSGALGLEALSRGAVQVTFVDTNSSAVRQIRQMLDELDTQAGQVIQGNAMTVNYAGQGPFELVFVDPPFGSLDLSILCTLIEESGCLADPARIYLETQRRDASFEVPNGWSLKRERKSGQVWFGLFERSISS